MNMYEINETHDPNLKSWVESANYPNTDFPIQNLPFVCFDTFAAFSVGTRIGDELLDLKRCFEDGLFDDDSFALAAVCGLVLDGALSWSGLITYRGDAVTLPPGGAPAWILAMWMAFALTLRHSLGAVCRRPALAALTGAVFGPLAYLGAERGFAAATLGEPRWQVLIALGIGWALALWLLALRVAREPGARHIPSSATPRNAT